MTKTQVSRRKVIMWTHLAPSRHLSLFTRHWIHTKNLQMCSMSKEWCMDRRAENIKSFKVKTIRLLTCRLIWIRNWPIVSNPSRVKVKTSRQEKRTINQECLLKIQCLWTRASQERGCRRRKSSRCLNEKRSWRESEWRISKIESRLRLGMTINTGRAREMPMGVVCQRVKWGEKIIRKFKKITQCTKKRRKVMMMTNLKTSSKRPMRKNQINQKTEEGGAGRKWIKNKDKRKTSNRFKKKNLKTLRLKCWLWRTSWWRKQTRLKKLRALLSRASLISWSNSHLRIRVKTRSHNRQTLRINFRRASSVAFQQIRSSMFWMRMKRYWSPSCRISMMMRSLRRTNSSSTVMIVMMLLTWFLISQTRMSMTLTMEFKIKVIHRFSSFRTELSFSGTDVLPHWEIIYMREHMNS